MDTSKPVTPEAIIAARPGELDNMSTHHVLALYRRWSRVSCPDWSTPSQYEKDCYTAAVLLKDELARRPHVAYGKNSREARKLAIKAGR